MRRFAIGFCLLLSSFLSINIVAAEAENIEEKAQQQVDNLKEPLYNPFVERYVLDELKQLRTDMANHRVELIEEVVDRELATTDKAVTYATDTVTYFFYLIAGVSTVLVFVGWTSIKDIRDKVHTLADEEVTRLVGEYEDRLRGIEKQLRQKSAHIDQNREEIEKTQEIHSLWLRAAQENVAATKINIYDQILTIKPDDVEAISYKADAVLELGEPQWAVNLCQQALEIDDSNGHAFYQLGCAYAQLGNEEEALTYLTEAIAQSDSYREEMKVDSALDSLRQRAEFIDLVEHKQTETS